MPTSYGLEDAIDDARFALTGIGPENVIGEDVFLRLVAAVAKALLEARRVQAQADGNVEAAQYFKVCSRQRFWDEDERRGGGRRGRE